MNPCSVEIPRLSSGQAGKGTMGCLISLTLLGVAIFAVYKAGPPYFAYKNFESEVKTEISRAGANFLDDDRIIKNMLDAARRSEVHIKRDNIKLDRFAEQLVINIEWVVPMDFVVYQRDVTFSIRAQSFIGRL